ncbi:MAG: YigZ family protein [Crocinitomicaceae bacterium]|nr:YigZ family protein [Crocinitomicaceae bacterium]
MNLPESYKVIATSSTSLFKDRGSKFIGYAEPVSSEEEIKEKLDAIRSEHPQARHVCYAFVLLPDHSHYRAADDGEPNNSAGVPILNQIRSLEVTNTLVAVVRYFGGTKLGVPGLINAYKMAAALALEEVKTEIKHVKSYYNIHFEYPLMNEIMRMAKVNNWDVTHQRFELDCDLEVAVTPHESDQFLEQFNHIKNIEIEHVKTA